MEGSHQVSLVCRKLLHKRIERIDIRLQKEAEKKDGRELEDIEADKEKARERLDKAEKQTKYVKGTLEAVERGAASTCRNRYQPLSLTNPGCARSRLQNTEEVLQNVQEEDVI